MTRPRLCTICDAEIPEARIELAPQTLTCSRACSAELTKRNRRKASKAWRDRQRAARDEER